MRHITLITLVLLVAAQKSPAPPSHTMDPNEMKFPEAKASGTIHGRPFVMEEARLEGGVLTLRRGKDHFPDLAVDVMLWYKQDEDPQGKKITVTPDQPRGGIPAVRYQWRETPGPRGGLPKTADHFSGYAMRLEVGQRTKDGKLPGKIYVCFPDDQKSVVAGTFEAVEKK
jgi:hypothetical protein